MKKVKNISAQSLMIPDVGVVGSGEIIEVSESFNNANFVEVESVSEKPKKEKTIINKKQ